MQYGIKVLICFHMWLMESFCLLIKCKKRSSTFLVTKIVIISLLREYRPKSEISSLDVTF